MYKKIIIIPPEKIKRILMPNQAETRLILEKNNGSVTIKRNKLIIKGLEVKIKNVRSKIMSGQVKCILSRPSRSFFC